MTVTTEALVGKREPVHSEVSVAFEPVMHHVAQELGVGIRTRVEPGGPALDNRGRPSHLPEDRTILELTPPNSTEPASAALAPFWLRTHEILGIFRSGDSEKINGQGLRGVHTVWQQAREHQASVQAAPKTRPLAGAGIRRR